jgi:hypothetical protein
MLLEGRDESLRSVPVAETSDRHLIAVFGLPPRDPCVLTSVNNGPQWTICVTGIGAQIPWLKSTHSAPPVRRTHLPMFTDRHPTVGTAVLNGLGDSPSGGLPATRRGRRRDTPQAVQLQGGPAPQEIFDTHPSAQQADPDAVTSVLAAVTGFFLWQARLPAPPGLPSLRRFQDAQGRAALAWLRTRTGWR